MTPKLQAIRDELMASTDIVETDCCGTSDIYLAADKGFELGFNAAVTELWPVIEFLLVENQQSIQCEEEHFSANMKKEKTKLKELLLKIGILE